MPGPVSDSYDPEWSTSSNRAEIEEALHEMHLKLGGIIGGPPKFILDVVSGEEGRSIQASFTERELRILRFACERARESL